LHETGTVVVRSTETRRPHEAAIGKAREVCARSGHTVADRFVDITEMVGIGSGAQGRTFQRLSYIVIDWLRVMHDWLGVNKLTSGSDMISGSAY
jgi:hypothetical protein